MSNLKPSEETILEKALSFASVEARSAYIQGACGDNLQLRAQVESLIQAHEAAGGFLPNKAARIAATVHVEGVTEEGPGTRIGRYKLLQQIGEGGMGVVYMAEQEEPVRRRVALKIIKLGMDTRQVVARFEAERQALALMDHPNIAKVLDGGATESGRPYFVMELVQGVLITEFCDKAKLSAKHRLKLFMQACQAVQHAHQKGIIHRDIKPSNVLVTLHDGVPVPKVIDFGIAKATNQKLTEKTLFTNFATMIGTPAYMSPEQAEMSGLDVDTRTDIYALGVLLYQLLTGTTPFPEKRLRSLGYGEMQRVILEEEPERPSTRLSTLTNEEKTIVARNCGEELASLSNLLKGDLDWIVMKSLEKDRQRRYETANGLANDIQRHLRNEPVIARPPSKIYRFQKFVRRNKVQFVAGTTVVAVLILALVLSSWQAAKAKRAEHTAREQTEAARLAKEQAEVARSAEASLAEQLNHIYRVRLGEEPRTVEPTNRLTVPKSFARRIIENDASITDVPAEVWQTYLALNRTNAESLLAAQRVIDDRQEFRRGALRQASTNFPNHPQVLFTAVTLDLFPEERRLWIERFKSAAPDNSLPFYLSARAYLKEGDASSALQELQTAVQQANLNDYFAERAQASEEIYLQQGRSPAEAKAVAGCAVILPHLSVLKDLASELAALQGQYSAAGDTGSLDAVAQLGIQLGRHLGSGTGADTFISQKIGLGIERTILDGLDPQRAYDWLGCTPTERRAQTEAELSVIAQARERWDRWFSDASDADIIAFFDRLKLYGEAAAMRWLDERSTQSPP